MPALPPHSRPTASPCPAPHHVPAAPCPRRSVSRPLLPLSRAVSGVTPGLLGFETRLRLFEPKSRGCGVDAAVVPHHVGFRGLQIAHAAQSAVDPVAPKAQSTDPW